MRRAIGVDLGGTKVAAAVVDEAGTVVERAEVPADVNTPDKLRATVAELLAALDDEGIDGLGVGAAGVVDHERGRYLYGPNTGLEEVDIRELLEPVTGLSVVVDNDANCAAWAEHRFGSGRGTRDFLCVTLGTGIGGGMVIGGRPYRGAHGGAAEIGHMLVDPDGPPCGCGRRGCWEQFASGQALEREARAALEDRPRGVLVERTGGDPHAVRGPMVTEAARAGDALALELVETLGRWVGFGLGSLVNVLEPARIAVSGGLVIDWDLMGPHAESALAERMEASDVRPVPDIVPADLGTDAGVVGAAWLVLES